eukprot:scaffold335219_cov63-Attheya_sp.AAC.1
MYYVRNGGAINRQWYIDIDIVFNCWPWWCVEEVISRDVVAAVAEIRGGSVGHAMLRWKVLAMTQQVETRAWLVMVMIY